MPDWPWMVWVLVIGSLVMVTALGYDIERALNELRSIRTALENIRHDMIDVVDEAQAIKRDRRRSEMLAAGIDPSD